jgi:hypothetical protein
VLLHKWGATEAALGEHILVRDHILTSEADLGRVTARRQRVWGKFAESLPRVSSQRERGTGTCRSARTWQPSPHPPPLPNPLNPHRPQKLHFQTRIRRTFSQTTSEHPHREDIGPLEKPPKPLKLRHRWHHLILMPLLTFYKDIEHELYQFLSRRHCPPSLDPRSERELCVHLLSISTSAISIFPELLQAGRHRLVGLRAALLASARCTPKSPHSLHLLSTPWCSQMPAPPHSLQPGCSRMPARPHSLHVLLTRWC